MANGEKTWETRGTRKLQNFGLFQAAEVERFGPHGKVGRFIVLDAPDWEVTIPVIEKAGKRYLIAVRQFRHGSGAVSVEFPGGVVERGEDPAAAALRELREETGYGADRLTPLGDVSPNPALLTNRFHVYLAENLHSPGEQCLDEHEIIDVEEIPEGELLARLGTSPYDHALMAAAGFLYLRYRGALEALKQAQGGFAAPY